MNNPAATPEVAPGIVRRVAETEPPAQVVQDAPEGAPAPSPVERLLARRARRRRVLIVVGTFLLASILLGNLYNQTRGGDDWSRFDRQTFVVQAVMAGDQLAIEPVGGGAVEQVKLLGIDAHPVAADGQPQPHWAMESYRALRDLAQGQRVMVTLPGLSPRTPDGRLHAYVFLDGDPPALSLNERLISDGHVYADRRREHAFHKQFDQAEQEARRRKRGLWADVRDDQQPAWRQRWLEELRGKAEPKP